MAFSSSTDSRRARALPPDGRLGAVRPFLVAAVPVLWGVATTLEEDPAQRAAAEVPEPPLDMPAPAESAPIEPPRAEPPAEEPAKAAASTACEPTPLTPSALAEALWEGHIQTFGRPPHADRWACAWAHCAFEQARGDAIHGNNLGHITSRGNTGRVCLQRVRERLERRPDRWETIDVWFRVFTTPADGAAEYWRVLASSYASVLARCDEADARGAAQRLAHLGYFTGPEAPYLEGMAALFVHARGALIPRVVATDPARFTLPALKMSGAGAR